MSAPGEDVMSEATESTETAYVSETPAPAAPTATATKSRPKIVGKGGHLAQTVGRRKEAIVRVRLLPGTGNFTLNGRPMENYFPNKVHQQLIKAPLVTVDRTESFDIFALLHGGGPSGQAGALRLGIARALILASPDDRPPLKKDRKSTRLNSSHSTLSRMPSSA